MSALPTASSRVPLARNLDRGSASDRLAAARPVQRCAQAPARWRCRAFTAKRRDELEPLSAGDGDDHPWHEWATAEAHQGQRLPGNVSRWNATKDLSFVPVRPERVLEVKYEHMEGTRLRHVGHFVRWRDDRTPESYTYEQLERPLTYALSDIIPGLQSNLRANHA